MCRLPDKRLSKSKTFCGITTLQIWPFLGTSKCWGHTSSSFNLIFMSLADNLGRHKISDVFKFQPDQTIDFGVTCPLVPKTLIFDLGWTIDYGVTCPLLPSR